MQRRKVQNWRKNVLDRRGEEINKRGKDEQESRIDTKTKESEVTYHNK